MPTIICVDNRLYNMKHIRNIHLSADDKCIYIEFGTSSKINTVHNWTFLNYEAAVKTYDFIKKSLEDKKTFIDTTTLSSK